MDAFNARYQKLVGQDPYRVEYRILDRGLVDGSFWTVREALPENGSEGSFILYETLRAEFTGPEFPDPVTGGRSGTYRCLLAARVVRGDEPPILEPGEVRSSDFLAGNLRDLDVDRAHRSWVEGKRAGTGRPG